MDKVACPRCGRFDHGIFTCPESKRDFEIEQQTKALKDQERHLAEQTRLMEQQQRAARSDAERHERERRDQERAAERAARQADPNYKSPWVKTLKVLAILIGISMVIALVEAFIKWVFSIPWWQWLIAVLVLGGIFYLIGKNAGKDDGE